MVDRKKLINILCIAGIAIGGISFGTLLIDTRLNYLFPYFISSTTLILSIIFIPLIPALIGFLLINNFSKRWIKIVGMVMWLVIPFILIYFFRTLFYVELLGGIL